MEFQLDDRILLSFLELQNYNTIKFVSMQMTGNQRKHNRTMDDDSFIYFPLNVVRKMLKNICIIRFRNINVTLMNFDLYSLYIYMLVLNCLGNTNVS